MQVPAGSEAAATDEGFVHALAKVYEQLVKVNRNCRDSARQPTRFHAIKAPDISIKDYLERIHKYFACSNECFVLSLIYVDRIIKLHERFTISILNIHRLMITSVMLATKFFDDLYYSNAFYARVGGVKTREINSLESHFLALINYQLFVSPPEYDKYRKDVLYHAGMQMSAAMTYSFTSRNASMQCGKHNARPPTDKSAPNGPWVADGPPPEQDDSACGLPMHSVAHSLNNNSASMSMLFDRAAVEELTGAADHSMTDDGKSMVPVTAGELHTHRTAGPASVHAFGQQLAANNLMGYNVPHQQQLDHQANHDGLLFIPHDFRKPATQADLQRRITPSTSLPLHQRVSSYAGFLGQGGLVSPRPQTERGECSVTKQMMAAAAGREAAHSSAHPHLSLAQMTLFQPSPHATWRAPLMSHRA